MTESKSQHQHRLNQLGKLVDEELEDERSGHAGSRTPAGRTARSRLRSADAVGTR